MEAFYPEDSTSKLIEVLRKVPNQKAKEKTDDTKLLDQNRLEWNRETNSYTIYGSISLHFRE